MLIDKILVSVVYSFDEVFCGSVLLHYYSQVGSLVSVVYSSLGQIHWHSLQSTHFALEFFDSL